MRLTEALHFYFGENGDLTKASKKVQYSHFCPSDADFALRTKLTRERKSKEVLKPRMVMEDLFE